MPKLNKRYADLHVHTYLSDGTFSPEKVVEIAGEKKLACIALTDHDCIDGIRPAQKEAKKYDIEIVPGVELTAEIEDKEVHVLGFFIEYTDSSFKKRLSEMCARRVDRALSMAGKLRKFGIELEDKDILASGNSVCISRLHLAQLMYKKGYVSSLGEAFRKYIGDNGPCYVSKFNLSPKDCIEMIIRIGGVPVLAHPYTLKNENFIKEFIGYGLRGLEVYHSDHSSAMSEYYKKMAEANNLLITGGSDCHGLGKGKILMGSVKVTYDLVERLKEEAGKINKNS